MRTATREFGPFGQKVVVVDNHWLLTFLKYFGCTESVKPIFAGLYENFRFTSSSNKKQKFPLESFLGAFWIWAYSYNHWYSAVPYRDFWKMCSVAKKPKSGAKQMTFNSFNDSLVPVQAAWTPSLKGLEIAFWAPEFPGCRFMIMTYHIYCIWHNLYLFILQSCAY